MKALLKEVWLGKTRWQLHDQLYLAYVVAKSQCLFRVIDDNYMSSPYMTFVRGQKSKG